ncbi:MAG: hydrogenase maturation protease [Candidatus Aerophobetes bacterium]|nr:hydrogenase maturation protease [Candidatus Aerophobetes bacterium]
MSNSLNNQRASFAIVGLGNYLLGDEGLGIHVIWGLKEIISHKEIQVIEANTPGMGIIWLIEGRKECLVVDAAYMDLLPGSIRRFTPEEARSRKRRGEVSLHQQDFLKILELARTLGISLPKIIIFAIQPGPNLTGNDLSPPVLQAAKKVKKEIVEWVRDNWLREAF